MWWSCRQFGGIDCGSWNRVLQVSKSAMIYSLLDVGMDDGCWVGFDGSMIIIWRETMDLCLMKDIELEDTCCEIGSPLRVHVTHL